MTTTKVHNVRYLHSAPGTYAYLVILLNIHRARVTIYFMFTNQYKII